jgi:hypothetical protein
VDIGYALVLDRMYKGKLKDGDLDAFSEEQIAQMKAEIEEKKIHIKKVYDLAQKINL